MKDFRGYSKEELDQEIQDLNKLENLLCDISVAFDFLNNNGDVTKYKDALYKARSDARSKKKLLEKVRKEEGSSYWFELEVKSYQDFTL